MKKYLFLLVCAVVVFFVASELRIERERIPTESEIVVDLLGEYAFNTPLEVAVLFNEETENRKKREKIKIIILKTNEEYLPKAQRVPDKSIQVIDILNDKLPDYDFGFPVSESASFFRMLTSNSDWGVSTIETSLGHFSLWRRVTDIHHATSLE